MAINVAGSTDRGISSYGAAAPYNYRDVFGFDNQPDSTNLPQIYEREVTIYGNRTLMGFLRMIGSEMPTNSQQIRWAEQKRLHVYYNKVRQTGGVTNGIVDVTIFDEATTVTEGAATPTSGQQTNASVRVGDKVLIGTTDQSTASAALLAYVNSVNTTTGVVRLKIYNTLPTLTANTRPFVTGNTSTVNLSILVIGTEFGKGSDTRDRVLQPEYDSYINNTVIQRDTFAVNGTDANQIGWVEIADENGVQGKYWYLKGKSETMTRWEDYQETALLEDRQIAFDSNSNVNAGKAADGQFGSGSEGLFEAIENRGNTTTGGFFGGQYQTGTSPGTASSPVLQGNLFLDDLDMLVEQLDREGNIEENVFYLNRTESLNFDDGMASLSNNSLTNSAWGLFNNSESMGLSLGFNSVRRGSYDFYKKDWKYLNQVDGRGSFGGIRGISVPMGTKSVYDQYGANLSMPFASIHYLAGPMGSRQNQSWVHGGQAPTPTSGLDSMSIEFLSEKCICLKGANNFFLFR